MKKNVVKQKAKLMAKEIVEKTKDKVVTYYEADKLVLEIIRSHLTDKFDWKYTKGIFEADAEFDCINPNYNCASFAYEIDDAIYLTVFYDFINFQKDLKEDEEERIKNLKIKVGEIKQPTDEDFFDRLISYK